MLETITHSVYFNRARLNIGRMHMDTDCKVLVFFMRHFSSSGCNIPRNTELEKFIVRKHKLELSLRNSLHSERHKEWLPHGMQTEKYRICSLQNYSTAPILFNGTPIGNSNSGNEGISIQDPF